MKYSMEMWIGIIIIIIIIIIITYYLYPSRKELIITCKARKVREKNNEGG